MANAMTPGVLGAFVQVDAATDAIRALRANGHTDLTVYNAAPNHEIEEALEHKVSPVRMFTLVGGLTGCAAGFAMTIWMSLDWPLLVGGKPFDSVPPYTVLAFELTILFGALFTVAGMMIGLLAGAYIGLRDLYWELEHLPSGSAGSPAVSKKEKGVDWLKIEPYLGVVILLAAIVCAWIYNKEA